MKSALPSFILLMLLWPARLYAWQADKGDGTYQNPILFADYSDPDVIRVGPDFYMVSSSFHFMPGIPILKSSDLVNWKIIGHVFPRLDIDPAYDMQNGNRYGGGCWAPAIRYHNNRFYVYFPTPQEGIFMSSAARAEGPWDPIVPVIAKKGLEDPCPFWDDDGSAYLIHSLKGAGPLILHRMSPDGKTVLDDGKIIVKDAANLANLEGPKLYKRNGYYYIFAPCWGVASGAQAVLRSKNIYGPYDFKIVLSQGSTRINGPHQGGYVETPSGQGWFLHFQSRGAYGRILHLEPVTWLDDWPVMGEPNPSDQQGWTPKPPSPDAITGQGAPGPVGQPVPVHPKPDVAQGPIQIPQTSDEFDGPDLGLQWEWNHNPVDDHWSLTERPGFLRLKALPATNLLDARNTLTQMLADPALDATTLLDTKGMAENQKAGLCMLCRDPSWIGVTQTQGQRHIVFYASKKETIGPELSQNTIQLKVSIAANETASYSYSLDGSTFIPLGSPAKIMFSWWKGARIGLFTFNTDPSATNAGLADFDWLHYQPAPVAK
jgi:beta-xylosidase